MGYAFWEQVTIQGQQLRLQRTRYLLCSVNPLTSTVMGLFEMPFGIKVLDIKVTYFSRGKFLFSEQLVFLPSFGLIFCPGTYNLLEEEK